MATLGTARLWRLRTPRAALCVMVAAAALVACGGSSGDNTAPTVATTAPDGGAAGTGAPAVAGMTSYSAGLSGAAEVPGPGDPDAVGSAVVILDPARSEICFEITVAYIDRPDAAHIHSGLAGETGPPVVTLAPLKVRNSNGCVPTETGVIEQIKSDPRAFYVNLHNPAYPDGAMRAQLAR